MSSSVDIDYLGFDGDNHYYEAEDAFTRHVPREMQERCVQWVEMDGRRYNLLGGKIAHAVVNPTWNPIAKPGVLKEYFRGNPNNQRPADLLAEREPLPSYYQDRDARADLIDSQGLEGCWLFPTLGVLYEARIHKDIEASTTLVRAFNQWLIEDWGFHYKEKIFAAPYITLANLDFAIQELEWSLENGAHIIAMLPGPAWTADGYVSPFGEEYDPFWSRVNEAGITVAVHSGDTNRGYQGYASDDGHRVNFRTVGQVKPTLKVFRNEDQAHDYFLSLALERMPERFPNLRVVSVESGAQWLPALMRKLKKQSHKSVGWFKEDPVALFKENVWINPFAEDDPYEVVDIMGEDRVVFGSDWPHLEGQVSPMDYLDELQKFDYETTKKIMRDNAVGLNELRPV
jgi:predicted TIM-barrel fold metal-dependent hydrolase